MVMKETNYTFKMDKKLRDRLKKLALVNRRTIAAQIRLILEEAVERLSGDIDK